MLLQKYLLQTWIKIKMKLVLQKRNCLHRFGHLGKHPVLVNTYTTHGD